MTNVTGPAICMLVACISLFLDAGSSSAAEQTTGNYPNKAIRLIVPWVPGGGTDAVTRIVAQKLSANMGQPVIVDNRPGSNGIIGADIAAKSRPDGYTMILHSVEHVINPGVYSKLPYDTLKDIAPLSLVGTHFLMLVVNPSSPAKSVEALVSMANSKPDEVTFGSWGTASLSHLSGELMKTISKSRMTHVPYKGAPQASTDVIAGRISFMFTTPPTSLALVRAGKLNAIAVTSTKRLPFLPDSPTMIESGYAGFDVQSWKGLFVPASTPKPIIARLNREIVSAVKTEDVRRQLIAAGFDAVTSTPEELATFSHAEMIRWGKVSKDAAVRID